VILVLRGREAGIESLVKGLEEAGAKATVDRDVDLTSMRGVRAAVERARPKAVIMGGWDDAEACEADPDRAFVENAEAAIHLAAACLEFKAVPILLSTAEVFGRSGGPWSESDEPAPMSTWARSRLRGEEFLRRAAKTHLILRTGPVLYDGLESERARLEAGRIEEAEDEMVTPIGAGELALAIHALLSADASGLFHVAPLEPAVSRADFWREVAKIFGKPSSSVAGKSGRELARKAAWARSPALLADKIRRVLPRPLRPWRESAAAAGQAAKVETPIVESRARGHRQEVRKVEKPWGHELIWARTDRYVGKILFVRAGERLSLQYHETKDETIYVLSGKIVFEVGAKGEEREDLILKAGDAYHITPLTTHRMIAVEDTQILETSTAELDDVVRLEDKYGRAGTKAP
jgi:mannose-6-phosphate isomerase